MAAVSIPQDRSESRSASRVRELMPWAIFAAVVLLVLALRRRTVSRAPSRWSVATTSTSSSTTLATCSASPATDTRQRGQLRRFVACCCAACSSGLPQASSRSASLVFSASRRCARRSRSRSTSSTTSTTKRPRPPVSRAVQDSVGLGTGVLLYGVSFGGLFALVFAAAYGRLGTMTARGTAAVLGVLGFVGMYLVPVLKYPANPPAIGNPDTIGRRTCMFLLMMLLSVAAMVVAVAVRRRIVFRFGEWNATLIVAGGYIAAMVLAFVLLPGVNEVPQQAIAGVVPAVTDAQTTFPPSCCGASGWRRFAIQAAMWTTIASGSAHLAHRLFTYEQLPAEDLVATLTSPSMARTVADATLCGRGGRYEHHLGLDGARRGGSRS